MDIEAEIKSCIKSNRGFTFDYRMGQKGSPTDHHVVNNVRNIKLWDDSFSYNKLNFFFFATSNLKKLTNISGEDRIVDMLKQEKISILKKCENNKILISIKHEKEKIIIHYDESETLVDSVFENTGYVKFVGEHYFDLGKIIIGEDQKNDIAHIYYDKIQSICEIK